MSKYLFSIILSLTTVACMPAYVAVAPGNVNYDGLIIKTDQAWNLAPAASTPSARKGSKVWTQDGILLDRIMIIPAVPDGEPLFVTTSKDQALPAFKADMLPNEIEEFTESSLVKLFKEGDVVVQTSNLRPHRFGEHNGLLFDINVAVSDGPNYRGITGAFIVDKKLNLIFFLGAVPYYFEKHIDEALVIIKGARV
jgi:hypothetical protein